ncbi:MAG TPA: glycosyltransferase family 2 protein [Gemmatimonadaceae bacterium]|nr:glycosyltransferase family 2 protein [Gemmatimonadaceae bacterium]
MNAPIVSFVVPCYNYGRYLRDCLDRIFAQEGGYDIEVIAINDCSSDDTLAILRSYQDPRLKIIDHEVNRGHIFTVNEGLRAATGKYVVRVDPDDRHHRHFLRRTVPILESHPEVGLVYGDVSLIDAEGRVTQQCSDVDHGGRDFKGNELIPLLKKNFICAPTVLARREAWMEAWPVPDGLAFNDWYFNVMLARNWEFYYVSEVLADYRVHGSNHHTKVSRDGTEERSVLWVLKKVYAEPERDAALERAKHDARRAVYASHHLDFATKYFGHGNNAASRRSYLQAIRYRPKLLANGEVLRRLAATLIPRPAYERAKLALRRAS